MARGRKKKVSKPHISPSGKEFEKIYCRKCEEMVDHGKFFTATNPYLDANNKMSICKDCINDMYGQIISARRSIDKTILELCRMLNVAYIPVAVSSTITQIESMRNAGRNVHAVFGLYMAKFRQSATKEGLPFTFQETTVVMADNLDDDYEHADYMKAKWGPAFSMEDYEWLESKYSEWQQSHPSKTMAEQEYLKLIVLKLWHNQQEIMQGKMPDIKGFNELTKNAALSPYTAKLNDSSGNLDNFSEIVETLFSTEPEEYYDDPEMYADWDNIRPYMAEYMTEPLSRFVRGNQDFYDAEEDEDEFYSEETDLAEGSDGKEDLPDGSPES